MPLVKPAVQSGINSQATQVQAQSAWFAGNLVRWRFGFLEKIGGWQRLVQAPFFGLIRRMHAWVDLLNTRHLFVANDGGLQAYIGATQYVFTRDTGYIPDVQRNHWFLANLGETGLIVASPGPLEAYKPPITNGAIAHVVGPDLGSGATAPQKNNGMFVAMPQAQVIVFGTEGLMGDPTTFDPLKLRWSDAGTYDVWSATVSNQAGTYRLSRGSKIVGGVQAPQTTLILTDTDLWGVSYVGPPLVYGFTILGAGCGLVAPHAIVTLGNTTYWLSRKGVWAFGANGVQNLPCSVWDYIFENLDTVNINKCHAAANATSNEVAFYFPPLSNLVPEGQNILLESQDFYTIQWLKTGATALPTVQFTSGYVYEPGYVTFGWYDGSGGLSNINWLDRDVMSKPTATVIAPDGTLTATTLREDGTTGVHQISQQILKQDDKAVYTFSLYVHKLSTRNVTLRATAGNTSFFTFNPTTGTLVAQGAAPDFVFGSWAIGTDEFATGLAGNGWLRYSMTFTSDAANFLNLQIQLTNGSATSYAGDGTSFAYIWGAQLNAGGSLLPYERTGQAIPKNETIYYIKLNVQENAWDSGKLPRTAWIDNSIWGTPLGADANKLVQQHERGFDADDQPMRGVFIESGYTELGDGTAMMSIHQCHPDFKWFGHNGEVRLTIKMKAYPNEDCPVFEYGPFSMTKDTQFFDPRARGRYAAIRYEWSPRRGFSARVGAPTYHIKPTGKRP